MSSQIDPTAEHNFGLVELEIDDGRMLIRESCEGHRGGIDAFGRPHDNWTDCDAEKLTWYELRTVNDYHKEHTDEDEDHLVEVQETPPDERPDWAEKAIDAAEGRIEHGPVGAKFDPDRPEISFLVATSETEYYATYNLVEEEVRE